MSKFIFPLLVVATMFVADYAFGAGIPHPPQSVTPAISQAFQRQAARVTMTGEPSAVLNTWQAAGGIRTSTSDPAWITF